MAPEQYRDSIRWITAKSILPPRVIQERHPIAVLLQKEGCGKPGQACAENKNGLVGCTSGHENRERSQMPKATASRCDVDRLMRGPNT